MNQRPPCVSRADLIRLIDAQGGLDVRAAATCGYSLGSHRQTDESNQTLADSHTESFKDDWATNAPAEIPNKIPRWHFYGVFGYESTGTIPVGKRNDSPRPLSNDELRVRYHQPGVRQLPLVPWSRLVAYLRHALGRSVATQRIHDRKLGRMLAKGLPFASLPRFTRRSWAPQAVLLCDSAWREMAPFQNDAAHLVKRLHKEMGKAGLKVIEVNGPPKLREVANLAPGVPVLAVSTLSQYEGKEHAHAAWAALADTLVARGHPIAALCPCPRSHWRAKVCAAWPITVWDGRPRPSLTVSWQHPIRSCATRANETERLLDLLAPAAFVERPLLRMARLKLGASADVGCEWEAWFHSLGWASSDCFGLVRPSFITSAAEQAQRMERRGSNELVSEIDEQILLQHGRHSSLIDFEARLRVFFSSERNERDKDDVLAFFSRVVERLRLMDPAADSREDQRSNLAASFIEMVENIPPQLRAHPQLEETLAEGLGLAHRFLQSENVDWSEGILVPIALRALTEKVETQNHIQNYQLSLRSLSGGGHSGKVISLTPHEGEESYVLFPLGMITSSQRQLQVTKQEGRKHSTQAFSQGAEVQALEYLTPKSMGEFYISSNVESLKCQCFTRPTWARRMWYDKYGLAAEFRVGKVPFVLRWIPPGRFLMGSPEDEPRRFDDEGPRHERLVAKGFWLGETVVTQAQWRAVMGQNLSHFKGPETLPVESITWQDCRDYCSRLCSLVPELKFRLPREEEWEYACRAGTDTALWTGGITIRKDYDAPELEDIAWYVGNSWKETVVENLYDMESLDWRHPEGDEAGTHAVKGKAANPWGLYDMLGNVWEWCEDVWDTEAYEKFGRGVGLPKGAEGAGRVVRGGSWNSLARYCRAASRSWNEPDNRGSYLGFRLAAGQEPRAAEPQGSGSDPDG